MSLNDQFNIASGDGLVKGIGSLPDRPALTVGMNTSEVVSRGFVDCAEWKCSKDGSGACGANEDSPGGGGWRDDA